MSHYSNFREKAADEITPQWQDHMTEQSFFRDNPEATKVIDNSYLNTNGPEQAKRFNAGKPQLSYLDLNCLTPAVRVLEFGAQKYDRNNWKKGSNVSQLIDSLLRHIADLQAGKTIDDDSGRSIIGHIQANAMFLGNAKNIDDITTNGTLYKEFLNDK